jgi:hypothetical protein
MSFSLLYVLGGPSSVGQVEKPVYRSIVSARDLEFGRLMSQYKENNFTSPYVYVRKTRLYTQVLPKN